MYTLLLSLRKKKTGKRFLQVLYVEHQNSLKATPSCAGAGGVNEEEEEEIY